MNGPTFTINGDHLEFYLDTKTKQWHIRKNHIDNVLVFSKAKGDAVIKFLELLKEQEMPEDETVYSGKG